MRLYLAGRVEKLKIRHLFLERKFSATSASLENDGRSLTKTGREDLEYTITGCLEHFM
jgi:hypothetical protein